MPPPAVHELVGREELMADLVQRLLAGKSPALSTAGMPGVGKTALAVALAYHPDVQAHFGDGILWAGLGTQPDLAGIQASWATALGVDISGLLDPGQRTAAIGNAIGRRRMLAVLDDAWALETAQMLRPGGSATCLLTTRDEAIARGFAPTQAIHVPELQPDPSLALLWTLAPEACEADPTAASALARATGGLPLTLELLGGYLAPQERWLFAELSQQAFAELADPRRRLALAQERLGGPRGQKQTLEATIALSLEQIERDRPAAAAGFYALGAFAPKPARFDRAAAAAVSELDASALALLIARNLLEIDTEGSLALHQALGDFAELRTPEDARVRHRDHYLERVETDEEDWQKIEPIYAQFLHTWREQLSRDADDGAVVQLADAIEAFQRLRGLRSDELRCLESALACVQKKGNDRETARFLNNIGSVYSDLGETGKALDYYEQALPLVRQVGDRGGEAATLSNIGMVYSALGEKGKALDYLEQALPLRRPVGDRGAEATTLNNIGLVYDDLGEKGKALVYYEQALLLSRQVGDRGGEAATLSNIGAVYSALGEKGKALDYYEQALPLRRQVGDRGGEAATLNNIGNVYSDLGERGKALAYLEHALPLRRQVGDRGGEATTLSNIGLVYDALGEKGKALDYLEQALLLFRQVGDRGGEAATLNNIGGVYSDLDEKGKALAYYEQALPLRRQVGDRWGESVTRYHMAQVCEALGEIDRAVTEMEAVVALDEATGHPDLTADRAELQRLRAKR